MSHKCCASATVAQWHSGSVMVQRAAALARVVRWPRVGSGAKRALKVFMRRVLHVKCNAGAASVGLGADAKKVALLLLLSVAVASAIVHGVCAIKFTSIDYNAAITPKRTSITARTEYLVRSEVPSCI